MDERKFERETDGFLRVRPTACPNCGGKMHHGTLRTPGWLDSQVFIDDNESEYDDERYQTLGAWICQVCGYVELHVPSSPDYRQ